MFGVGLQELLIIGLLFLLIFGPGKAAGMARDLGRFLSGAQDSVEAFKEELLSEEEVREARRTVGEVKSELTGPVQVLRDGIRHSSKEPKTKVAGREGGDEPAGGDPLPDAAVDKHRPNEVRETLHKEEASPPSTIEQRR